ncbi:MAG TPA: U32 family peptidase [Candidatus Methylacidiphilales bacterium]|nr:U32 family peptidase [Candidatus Methylacidiphilales bacterium]
MTSDHAKPELLSPAGDWECARAAVANGADAIYFGLPAFNARMRAANFTAENLPKLMAFLHEHGVKGYAAFNTLIFTDEIPAAEEQLLLLAHAGVDAAIVQDLGLAALARELVPALPIHASTQMTLTSPEGIAFARRLGMARAVLARELSLRDLAKFRSGAEGLPLEVFVHGALCVAYSGQCLTSEALGRRSANRGECAQACRLPYELLVDGEKRDLGDRRYLLSPQDLAAVEEIPELMRLGIVSFKIEGRLKTPEYVAAVTQVYRRAIDRAWEAQPSAPASSSDRYKLEMAFSRGLYSGWLHGVNHQRLVHARFGKKRGAFIGVVTAVGRHFLEVRAEGAVRRGDGVVIDQGGDTENEQGGRVYEATPQQNGLVRLAFERGKIDFDAVKPGDRIWKTDDPQLNRELRKSWAGEIPPSKRALDIVVSGRAGRLLRIEGRTGGISVWVESVMPLQAARKHPLTAETLREQLGRLGGTGFNLGALHNQLKGEVIIPVSELNRLRRELVEKIEMNSGSDRSRAGLAAESIRAAMPFQDRLAAGSRLAGLAARRAATPKIEKPVLAVLCRSLEQIDVALRAGVIEIYADFEDIRRYRDAVERVRSDGGFAQILLATPRIQKAGEQGFFRLIENARPNGVLIRNLGALDYFRERSLRRVGDFSLNVANPLTAELLMAEKLARLTVSCDLNAVQVLGLLQAAPPGWFEITLHQHIPMFHMEHCVFAAFLSEGTDHTNCGRPCDSHRVELRDRVGLAHPLKADVGCRNTLFHAQAQSGAAFFETFRACGPAAFRVELLLEDAVESERIIRGYQRFLAGSMTGPALVRELNLRSQLGVTVGTLAVES